MTAADERARERADVIAQALRRREVLDQARSPLVRRLLVVGGMLSLGLATVGVVLPLLPTTPLVLLAAACFARSSPRFYRWMLSNKLFGHHVASWRINRCMPRRAKVIAITLIVVTIGSSAIWAVSLLALRVLLGTIAVGVILIILRIPSCVPSGRRSPLP